MSDTTVITVHTSTSPSDIKGLIDHGRHGVLECRGHATHDHRHMLACYTQSHGCPRECLREDHPGARPAPRPARRDPTVGGLFERSDLPK